MFACLHKQNRNDYFQYTIQYFYFPIKSLQLSIYSLFSCQNKSFSFQQKHFNLMWIIHIIVCLLFSCTSDCQEAKPNKLNQMVVLLQRDFRLKV